MMPLAGSEVEQIDFSVKKSIRYHSRRCARFERLDLFTKWLTAVAGAMAFAAIVGDARSGWAAVLTFIITALAFADVVVSFGSRAHLHKHLYRCFSEMAVEIAQLETPAASDLARLRAKRLALESEEPHIIDALERWCWNEEAESRGATSDILQTLSKWQRFRARIA